MIEKVFKKFKNNFVSPSEASNALDLSLGKAVFELKYKDDVIGFLEFKDDQWSFYYSVSFKTQVEIAPIITFPDVNKKYEGRELWSFFSSRIPDNIGSSKESTKKHNLDLINQLKNYGRKTITNPFDLLVA